MSSWNKRNLLFVTTSLGTKWEKYSQQLIERAYPEAKRIIVDGRKGRSDKNGFFEGWHPLQFLEHVKGEEANYTVHIDEDCFLLDAKQLDAIVREMEKEENVVLAGVPDGGMPRRDGNPCACNLFFVVFKTKKVLELLEKNKGWRELVFEESFKDKHFLESYPFSQEKIDFGAREPYYPFFWLLLKSGCGIKYLKASFNQSYGSTDVFTESPGKPMARHMWFLRKWDFPEHRKRYELLEEECLKPMLEP